MKELRFAHRLWSFTVDPRNLVFVDETGIHLGFTRLCGRAPFGERLYDSEPGNQLWVGAIVLMDNLPVHHAEVIREAVEAVGAKLVFLGFCRKIRYQPWNPTDNCLNLLITHEGWYLIFLLLPYLLILPISLPLNCVGQN